MCLMYFPALNTTACCQSSICTECHAQVRYAETSLQVRLGLRRHPDIHQCRILWKDQARCDATCKALHGTADDELYDRLAGTGLGHHAAGLRVT